jgi:hypothetical protein
MRIVERIARLERRDSTDARMTETEIKEAAERSEAAFCWWATALDDVAGRKAVGAGTDEDQELLSFLQGKTHENR